MSIAIPHDILRALPDHEKQRLQDLLTIREARTPKWRGGRMVFDTQPRKTIETLHYHPKMSVMCLPFARAVELGFGGFRPQPVRGLSWPPFRAVLRDEQEQILRDLMDKIRRRGSALVAVYPGGGKTITTLRACRIMGQRTVIIVNRLVLMEQWRESIVRCFGEGDDLIHLVSTSKAIPEDKLFYIVNAVNIPKFDIEIFLRKLEIRTVVVDECHLIMTRVFVQSLGFLAPRFLIGLSATPYRTDGMDEMFDTYFESPKTCIFRPLRRFHHVHLLETPIRMRDERSENGRLNWNKIIDEQSFHSQRMQWVVDLCAAFSDRRILILGKRVEALTSLRDMLGADQAALFTASDKQYDASARILVSTFLKVGTGFSHDCLDMLILFNDTEEYFLQYLGRVFRRPDVVPIIMDIVDRHPVLQNHYKTRKKVYSDVGGIFLPAPPQWKESIRRNPPT